MVLVGVTVRRERYGDHDRVRESRGRREAGPQQADGRERRRPVPDEGHQDHPTLDGGQPGDLVLVEGVGDGDERGARVLLARLGGGQVEPAERPELGVGEGGDLAVRGHPRQRQPLGVHQLDLDPGQLGRQREGDR